MRKDKLIMSKRLFHNPALSLISPQIQTFLAICTSMMNSLISIINKK